MISENFRANANIDHKDDRKNRGVKDTRLALVWFPRPTWGEG